MKSILAVILSPVLIMEYIYTKSQTLPAGRRELKVKSQKNEMGLLVKQQVSYASLVQHSFENDLSNILEKTEELMNICFGLEDRDETHTDSFDRNSQISYTSKTKRQHRLSV